MIDNDKRRSERQKKEKVRRRIRVQVDPDNYEYMYHGYKEANVNTLIDRNHLDPYSGFAGYRQSRCNVRKAGE